MKRQAEIISNIEGKVTVQEKDKDAAGRQGGQGVVSKPAVKVAAKKVSKGQKGGGRVGRGR